MREDLRFSGEPAEGAGMNDAGTIPLEGTAVRMSRFGMLPLR